MTAREYEAIQGAFRKKLKKQAWSNREEGFNEGIRCAMSILHGMYTHQQNYRKEQKV